MLQPVISDWNFIFIFLLRRQCENRVCFYVCFQDEQNKAPLSNLLEIVNTVRSFGNRSFKQSHYDNAKDHYKKVALHCVTVQPVFFFM